MTARHGDRLRSKDEFSVPPTRHATGQLDQFRRSQRRCFDGKLRDAGERQPDEVPVTALARRQSGAVVPVPVLASMATGLLEVVPCGQTAVLPPWRSFPVPRNVPHAW